MIALANGDMGERSPDQLDLEHSKRDIALVRGLARAGLLSEDDLQACARRLAKVAETGKEERIRVAADKALSVMQISLLRLLKDAATGSGAQCASVSNTQINFYLPSNGREDNVIEATNGHSGNGKH